jgi:hypothetical protein
MELMIVRGRIFCGCKVWELICELVGLVDQSGQTLWADIKLLTLEF